MRTSVAISFALLLAACGGAPPAALSSAAPTATAIPTVAPTPTPVPTFAPTAEGFASKVLVEKPRNLATSAPGQVWIKTGADANVVSATVSEKESFTASYEPSTDKPSGERVVYTTAALPPLAAGRYTEGLRLVTVQQGGRSNAHMHSGIEGVLVLEGRVLIRSGGNSPTFLTQGQGFYILPKVPVQLINMGTGIARTLVYSISPEGAPFSTELSESP